ncbi:aldo/keto reductase [Fimbriimonas ginsengisoli]|uniref:Aldo/keto reductase n=1 Tax=Fimbriimonas ginsengisoli Gsoil 348 TaxID=661478 RepID=A0A068NTC6_FIMGI|nr:aldo/keto reductase [Fimbriimonas ginsengisoli]AIE86015.1 aldo/keto reductase [Fimbriimonas ginsengisoli Gsoil 348]
MISVTPLSGKPIPRIGLGTFGSDKYGPPQVADAVRGAIEVGYRHFDCAAVYGNEREVGAALRESGLAREDYWVTGKVWNNRHHEVVAACEDSLRDLGLDYLDLFLIHWPFPNHHASGVAVDSRDPHAVPYIHENFLRTWASMRKLVDRGLVRYTGTSNMTVRKLQLLLRDAEVQPAANEMELHPHFQQRELFEFVTANGILPIGYSPLGSPSRPERDRTSDDTSDLDDPVIVEIARAHNIHPADVCIKWAVTRGQIPIPFSVKRSQYESSLRAATSEPLTPAEMDQIAKIDRNCRLIKGQVFLWPGAADWRDLWDEQPV